MNAFLAQYRHQTHDDLAIIKRQFLRYPGFDMSGVEVIGTFLLSIQNSPIYDGNSASGSLRS